jgi:hypothetical protein
VRLLALACGVVAAGAVALGGCGGIVSSDLFLVQRSGSTAGARLSLLISEEGIARCDNGAPHRITDPQLIKARVIQEHLESYASKHLSLPPQPGSVLSYSVRDANGSVSFADNSSSQPPVLRELALLVLEVAIRECHLSQAGA